MTEPVRLHRMLDSCLALGEVMADVPDLPDSTADQIASSTAAVAGADTPDWAFYFGRELVALSAGAAGHLTLDVPDDFEDLLAGLQEDRRILRPLLGPAASADPTLQVELRAWQADHGFTPVPRDDPSPLR